MKFNLRKLIRRPIRRKVVKFRRVIVPQTHLGALETIMLRMVAPLAGAAARIQPAYAHELERRLQQDSTADVTSEAENLSNEIDRIILQLTPDLRQWALRTEKIQRDKWGRALRAALDVQLETMLGPEDVRETLDAFLLRSTSLIRDVNEQARGRIMDAILRGIQQRTPTDKVAKDIAEAADMGRARARRIAAHQSLNLNAELNRERRRQAGLNTWIWRHSAKLHPRPVHLARNGHMYTDEDAPADLPGVLPNCGCTEQAVLVIDGEVIG